MKRSVWMLLLIALLLALGCAWAEEEQLPAPADIASWPGSGIGEMEVVNCEEWVSLRKEPSTSSEQLAKIALGQRLHNCIAYSDEFTLCETDEGQRGYVLSEYLLRLEHPSFYMRRAGDAIEGTAIIDDIYEFSGENSWYFNAPSNGCTVFAQRMNPRHGEGGDALCVSCFSGSRSFLWGLYTACNYSTELELTDCFLGGTPEHALAIVNNAQLGIAAIDIRTGELEWTVEHAQVDVGASQSHALANDGTLYVGGYYGPDPVAISADGEVLWQSDAGEGATWLYEICVEEDEIVGEYDAPDDDSYEWVRFDRATGAMLRARYYDGREVSGQE